MSNEGDLDYTAKRKTTKPFDWANSGGNVMRFGSIKGTRLDCVSVSYPESSEALKCYLIAKEYILQ